MIALAWTVRYPAVSSAVAAEDEPQIAVRGVNELIALDKVLREAKFSEEPQDHTIAGSPIVAKLARRTRAALQQRFPTSEVEYEVQPGRREWMISVRTARRAHLWQDWSRHEKESHVRDLLSPYDVSDANIERFIDEVDGPPGI